MVNFFFPDIRERSIVKRPFSASRLRAVSYFSFRFAHRACGSDEGRYIFGIQNESETDIDAITNESFDQFSLTFVLPRFPNISTTTTTK